jgi:hypothetical protein
MLWDLYQSYQIQQLDKKIDIAQETALGSSGRSVLELEARVSRLALICRAMFELMQESAPGLTEGTLSAKVVEIDLRDGQADGQMTPRGKRCPKCEAMMSPKFGRCLFCGHKDGDAVSFG